MIKLAPHFPITRRMPGSLNQLSSPDGDDGHGDHGDNTPDPIHGDHVLQVEVFA